MFIVEYVVNDRPEWRWYNTRAEAEQAALELERMGAHIEAVEEVPPWCADDEV